MKLSVYLNAFGSRSRVGILYENGSDIYFEYDPEFLESGIELSPFHLPLKRGIFQEQKGIFDGLFGLFNDSLPDGWGCLLLDRKLRRQGMSYGTITPLMRLSMIGKDPMGALEYEPADEEARSFGALNLDSLSGEIDTILKGESTDVLDELVALNGSSGGARPKITAWVSDDKREIIHGRPKNCIGYSQWLIKFSQKEDAKNLGEEEYRYSLAAKASGIDMPETFLFPSKTCSGYFGIKRFDRTPKGKVHIHSACGLLHASHRYGSLDYENLLKLTIILTKRKEQTEEMARRMLFNVLWENRDDHSKNFSFMLNEKNLWELAPAYDLTPSAGLNGEQTAMVNGKGRSIVLDDFIAAAASVNISKDFVLDAYEKIRLQQKLP